MRLTNDPWMGREGSSSGGDCECAVQVVWYPVRPLQLVRKRRVDLGGTDMVMASSPGQTVTGALRRKRSETGPLNQIQTEHLL